MNEMSPWLGYYTNMSCPTYKQVMSHVWMSHVPHKCGQISRFIRWIYVYGWDETWLIHMWDMTHSYVAHNSFRLVVSYVVASTCMNEMRYYKWRVTAVRHTHERIMSHIWMSHVTHMNESCPTYEWVMRHIWMRHVPHMNELRPMSHIWMSHVPHMNESCATYECVMSHIWMSYVRLLDESCQNCWQGSRVTWFVICWYVTWLIHME